MASVPVIKPGRPACFQILTPLSAMTIRQATYPPCALVFLL